MTKIGIDMSEGILYDRVIYPIRPASSQKTFFSLLYALDKKGEEWVINEWYDPTVVRSEWQVSRGEHERNQSQGKNGKKRRWVLYDE